MQMLLSTTFGAGIIDKDLEYLVVLPQTFITALILSGNILYQSGFSFPDWKLIDLLWLMEPSHGPYILISTVNSKLDLHLDCSLAIS